LTIKKIEQGKSRFYRIMVSRRSTKFPHIRIQRQGVADTQKKALALEEQLKEEVFREMIKREDAGISWIHLIDEWELFLRNSETEIISPVTKMGYIQVLRDYTFDFRLTPASEVNRVDVMGSIESMKKQGLSNGRIRALVTAVNRIHRWAVDLKKIPFTYVSPAHGISFSRKEEKPPEVLNFDQVKEFLRLAKEDEHPWYPVWAVAVLTGMRIGELFALEWQDIDFQKMSLTVSKSFCSSSRKIKCTKSGAWREVPINEDLYSVFQDLNPQATGYILPRNHGWNRGEAARILRKFLEGNNLPSVRFHALRACFATLLLRRQLK